MSSTVRNVEQFLTFEAADTAHGSKYGGLHFNIPHSSFVRFPQIFQFFFVREGAERSVKSALTCRDTAQGSSASMYVTRPRFLPLLEVNTKYNHKINMSVAHCFIPS